MSLTLVCSQYPQPLLKVLERTANFCCAFCLSSGRKSGASGRVVCACVHRYVHDYMHSSVLYVLYMHIYKCFYYSHALTSRQWNWFPLCYASKTFTHLNLVFCNVRDPVWLNVAWRGGFMYVGCFIALHLNRNLSILLTFESLLAKWERGEPVSYFCLVLCLQ